MSHFNHTYMYPPNIHTHTHTQHYDHLVNLLGVGEKKEKLVTVREDRWPINYLMAPIFRDPRRKSTFGLKAVADVLCIAPYILPCPVTAPGTEPPCREVQGLGFLGRSSQALWV